MRNNGWKRAGCVLLAAQMTVSVLPMNSLAAYVNGQGRSDAILKASVTPQAVHTSRGSFQLSKDQMPLLKRHVVSFAPQETKTALDASPDQDTVPPGDGEVSAGTREGPGETPIESPTVDEGSSTDSIEGEESLPPPGEGEETPEEPILPPDTGGEGETPEEPILPPGTGGEGGTPEGPTLPPDIGGGEEIPEEPILPPGTGGERETPEEPILPPDTGGEEEPPESPAPDEGELPPVDPAPGEDSGEEPGTELPGDPEPVTPEETPPVTEIPGQPPLKASAAMEEDTVVEAYLNVYGYTGWTSRGTIHHSSDKIVGVGGYDYIYPPYNQETPPGQETDLDGDGYVNENRPDYVVFKAPGDLFMGPMIEALATLELSRIPDLRFEGWIFSQVNPADRGDTESLKRNDEMIWNNRYWSGDSWSAAGMPEPYPEGDPYEPTFDAIRAHADQSMVYYNDENGYDHYMYTTNVVAKWVESHRADLTRLTLSGLPRGKSGEEDRVELELYGADFTAAGQYQKDQEPVELKTYDADGTVRDEYYVQVPVHIDRLALDFTTYEPGTMIKIEADGLEEPLLYQYDRKDYIWYEADENPTIDRDHTAEEEEKYGKYDKYDERNADPDSPLLREQPGRSTGMKGTATNSYEDPARANWSLPIAAAIPLEVTTPKKVYTDVTITVVAPDGSMEEDGTTTGTTATYTLHVRRMADPEMELNPGNTPYGMIRAEKNLASGADRWTEVTLRKYFDDNRKFPTGQAILLDHNGGAVYQGKFSEEAWTGTDYDSSETALVVYQDATFTDPGFTLTDSQGLTVDSRDLKRSIRLRRVSSLTTECIHEGVGEEVYYSSRTLVPDTGDVVMETVVEEGGKDTISLKGLHIVPGIYTMEYSYEDPASDETYNSVDTSVYMDTTKAANFSRPLIVLPKPGDVDMDGMITLADAIALEELLNTPGSFVNVDSSDAIERLFKYRVCDVDGDGEVTKTDVAKLKNGYVPTQKEQEPPDYFYLNAGDRGEQERNDLITEPSGSGRAEISVEYLGKSILGIPDGVVNEAEVELGDTFWVGVRLKNAAALPNLTAGVKAFEFTFLYDPSILSPGYLQDMKDNWRGTIEAANLSSSGTTPWKDAYALVGNSGPEGTLISYPELAVPGLVGSEGKLSTYTIALQLKEGQVAQSLSEGYLLYIPFTMINHPAGVEHSTKLLIEPAMGGREFSIVYTDGSATAWSGQDTIFGDSTQELKTGLAYTGMAMIPVGEDKTPCITLYDDESDDNNHVNARYGEPFKHTAGGYTSGGDSSDLNNHPDPTIDSGSLPPGMSYVVRGGIGYIETTSEYGATQAGSYRFYIGGVLYRIIVDKAPLTLSVPRSNGKYYGETNPKPGIMEFEYDASQLKKQELDRVTSEGLNNNGKGQNLAAILANDYTRPTLKPVDGKGVSLDYRTPAGTYITELTGGVSTNYVFQYLRQGETEPNTEKATNIFTVSPRPIIIEKIEGPVGRMPSRPEKDSFSRAATARYGEGPGNFTAKLPDDPSYAEGSMYQLTGRPVLEGDDLALSYLGIFEKDDRDTKPGYEFTLAPENEQEERKVTISSSPVPSFTGEQAENYQILNSTDSIPKETTGIVFRVPVTELELVHKGSQFRTEYTYGENLTLLDMGDIVLHWENGAEDGPIAYTANNVYGFMLCWVDKVGDLPSAATAIPGYSTQPLTVKEHDGKYLCLYVSNGKNHPEACVYMGPYTVHKANLTLSVEPQQRYYGEPDAKPVIKYSLSDLKGEDRKLYQYGLLQELEAGLAGFRDLEISYRETASASGRLVNDRTDAGNYFVVLSKAVANNYVITYKQPGVDAPSGEFGYAAMTVVKRPVVVNRVTGTVGFFYDDTNTKVMTVQGTAPAAENQSFGLEVSSPTADYCTTENAAYFYSLGSLSGDPILAGDTLTVTYRATFDADRDTKPFFDTNGWTTDTKTYDVAIDNLRLNTATGAGRNYQLVYSDSETALNGQPQLDHKGSGDVIIRRIDHLEIKTLPQSAYTYGDYIQLDGRLEIRIHYVPEKGHSSYDDVLYYTEQIGGVVVGTSFEKYGLRLEWSDENGAPAEGVGPAAWHGQLMKVTDHDGKYLVVRGKHHESHDEKIVVAEEPITVAKKVLHVKPKDIQRMYGESNLVPAGPRAYYWAEVNWKEDLIPEDWNALVGEGFDMDGTATPNDMEDDLSIYQTKLGEGGISNALTFLDPTYVGPEFRTAANEGSPVGRQELVLSGGKLGNYSFEFKPGVVEITKRQIMISGINTGAYSLENPLATMIVGGATTIPNVMASYSRDLKQVSFNTAPGGSPPAVLGDDELTVSMTVKFGYKDAQGNTIPSTSLTAPDGEMVLAWVMISDVKIVKGSANYELVNDKPYLDNPAQVGRIDGRTIDRIEFSDPDSIRTQYDYGDSLDLGGLKVNIFYKYPPGASYQPVDRNVAVTSRGDLSLHYLPDPTLVEDPGNWAKIAQGVYGKAAGADLLRIAPDGEGFSHQGKYLVVSAQASRTPGDYAKPLMVGKPLNITPRTLQYTLTADTKPYDGTTKAWGTVRMDANQIHSDDVVYVDNGTKYDSMDMELEGVNYLFHSNKTYGTGFRFEFADRNVAYEEAPGHDSYGALKTVNAGVYNVALSGKDAANYVLEKSSIPYDDPDAACAIITRAQRPAPDVAGVTTMSTDIHTNTMTVFVDKAAPTCGDSGDDYNDELHYEYKLEYLTDETDLASGFRTVAEKDVDSPFFGGEPVEVESEDFEAAPGEKEELTPGMGQPTVEGDSGFGERTPLPRDTYFRALVRLAGTHNYEPSEYTPSVSDTQIVEAIAGARSAEESDDIDPVLSDPGAIEPPRPIPEKQALGKSYQYRIDVVAAQTMRGTDGKEHVRSQLDGVWFADRATYPNEDYLNAFVTETEEPRYQAYSWDCEQDRRVTFPLDMEETVVVNLPQADGSTAPETVCGPETGGTIRLYASLVPLGGGGSFYNLTILNGNITAHVGDEPLQLQVEIEPANALGLYWESSDTTVVTVDQKGLLTFVGEGTARVSVFFGDYRASITVTVLPAEVKLPQVLFNWDYLDAFMVVTEALEFRPERTMNRGELAIILAKFLPPLAEELEGEAPDYVDMSEDMDCFRAVESLSRLKLLKGVGEDRFAPDQTVTRAEMAAILVRMGSLPIPEGEGRSFLDSGREDTWAWKEIEALGQAGITRGTGDNYFSPDRALTRAEAAVLLTRMLRYKLDPEQEGLLRPVDVEREYWAWREILQAVNGVNLPKEAKDNR